MTKVNNYPQLEDFKVWLNRNYVNLTTQKVYFNGAGHLLSEYKKSGCKDLGLTQDFLDFVISFVQDLQRQQRGNSFYKGCAKALFDYMSETNPDLKFSFPKDRSRKGKKLEESKYRYFEQNDIDKLINEGTPYISLVLRLIKDTGLRLNEFLTLRRDMEKKRK